MNETNDSKRQPPDKNMTRARNPGMARGGIFWSARNYRVRTDSVCHCVNALVSMISQLEEDVLINIPEVPSRSTQEPE